MLCHKFTFRKLLCICKGQLLVFFFLKFITFCDKQTTKEFRSLTNCLVECLNSNCEKTTNYHFCNMKSNENKRNIEQVQYCGTCCERKGSYHMFQFEHQQTYHNGRQLLWELKPSECKTHVQNVLCSDNRNNSNWIGTENALKIQLKNINRAVWNVENGQQ